MPADYVYFDEGTRKVAIRKDAIAALVHHAPAPAPGRSGTHKVLLAGGQEIPVPPAAFELLVKTLGACDVLDVPKLEPPKGALGVSVI